MKRPRYDTQGSESLAEVEVKPLIRPRARKGGLSLLPSTSLDVLFEVSVVGSECAFNSSQQIFGFLKPLDLLSLARTSKAFRNLLMCKSNAFIWRASRALIPKLPHCPADLSEPQYARLAFDPHCHVSQFPSVRYRFHKVTLRREIVQNCGDVAHNVIWQFRIRYCGSCLKRWTKYDIPLHALAIQNDIL
jgi:hypothetical protein